MERSRIRATSIFHRLQEQVSPATHITSLFALPWAETPPAALQTGQRLVERAIALPTNLCGVGRRAGKRSRLELKIASATRVLYIRQGVSKIAPELLGRIIVVVDATGRVPHDGERHHCRGWLPKVTEKRVLKGVVVFYVQGVHFERGCPCA